jgi:hypothetical protein
MVSVLISISFEYICCKNAMLLLPQFYSAGQLFICNEQKCILPFFLSYNCSNSSIEGALNFKSKTLSDILVRGDKNKKN